MPKTARKKQLQADLPKRAPRKSGKRGIGPAPEADELQPDVQTELPGMEDRHIEEIEDAALSYVRIRDRRIALSREEHDLKETLHTKMKQFEKTIYRVAEMEVKIVSKEETVKVKLTDHPDEE
jgi:hypothetical protein